MTEENIDHEKRLLTVKQFARKSNEGWPTENAIRALILGASWGENNFQTAFIRVGRRVLIDPEEFWRIVREQKDNNSYKKVGK